MKCTNCRADLEGGAKFCTLCGTPVPEGVVPEDPKSFDFGAILVATKAFFANVCGKIKPACAAGCGVRGSVGRCSGTAMQRHVPEADPAGNHDAETGGGFSGKCEGGIRAGRHPGGLREGCPDLSDG